MASQGLEGMVEVKLGGIHKGRPAKIEIFRPRLPYLCGVARKLTPHPTLGHPRVISDGFL